MSDPLGLVMLERARQDRKWGEQNHGDEIWYMILAEEIGELAKALLPSVAGQEGNAVKELVEVAAVALAWLEAIERRTLELGLGQKKGEKA